MKPLKSPHPHLSSLLSMLTDLPSRLTTQPLNSPPINGLEKSLMSGGLLPFLPGRSPSMVLSWAGQAPHSTSAVQESPNSMLPRVLGNSRAVSGWAAPSWSDGREQDRQGNLSTTCGQTDTRTRGHTHTHTRTHDLPHRLEAAQSPQQPPSLKSAKLLMSRPFQNWGSLEVYQEGNSQSVTLGEPREQGGGWRPLAFCNIVCLLDPLVVWGFLAVETSPRTQELRKLVLLQPCWIACTATYTARPDHLHMWFQFFWEFLMGKCVYMLQKCTFGKNFYFLPSDCTGCTKCPAHPHPHIIFSLLNK